RAPPGRESVALECDGMRSRHGSHHSSSVTKELRLLPALGRPPGRLRLRSWAPTLSAARAARRLGHAVFRYGNPSVVGGPLAQGPMYSTLLATNAATSLAWALCRIPLGIRPPTPCSIAFSTLEEFAFTVSALLGPVASNWSRFGPIWPSVPAAAMVWQA